MPGAAAARRRARRACFAALNSRVKVQDLLQAVIIQSANDASIALAQAIAGNETAFAIQMNARAKELGLTKSNFTNSTGLPDRGMQMSVRDLSKLARHLIHSYPQYYSYYAEKEFTWNKIRQFNRNPLLAMNIGADGMKTGFTSDGGYGLVGSAIQNGWRLVVVVNGLKSDKERADEAKRLLEWGYRTFEARLLFAEGSDRGRGKSLRRRIRQRAAGRGRTDQPDGAAQCQRTHRGAHCL